MGSGEGLLGGLFEGWDRCFNAWDCGDRGFEVGFENKGRGFMWAFVLVMIRLGDRLISISEQGASLESEKSEQSALLINISV